MDPKTVKTSGLTAAIMIVLFVVFFVGLRGTGRLSFPQPSTSDQVAARDQAIDSLGKLYRRIQSESDGLRQSLAVSHTHDSVQTQKVASLLSIQKSIEKKYETLARYDTLPAVDILGYLSDSIPSSGYR